MPRTNPCTVFLLALVFASLAAATPRAVGQQSPGQFRTSGKSTLPGDAHATFAVGIGDVDGDGDDDVIWGNVPDIRFPGPAQTRLWLNDGAAVFTDATSTHLPSDDGATWAVALGDVDADGDLDLVLGTGLQDRLYLNDGTGRFSDATAGRWPVATDYTRALQLADLDGDGDLDAVIGVFDEAGTNKIYRNDGTGTFVDVTASALTPTRDQTTALAVADVTGDGIPDLITGNEPVRDPRSSVVLVPGPTKLYANDGTGIFTEITTQSLPHDEDDTFAVEVGDIDGDSDLDLLMGYSGGERLYLNNGAGVFTDATARLPNASIVPYDLAFGDTDGDGDLDIVIVDQPIGQYVNDGQGNFTAVAAAQMPLRVGRFPAIALADLDGDTDLDLAAGDRGIDTSGRNHVYRNIGGGSYVDVREAGITENRHFTRAIAAGDVDGDGDDDLVFGTTAFETRLYLNDDKGRYAEPAVSSLGSGLTNSVALGDVDGDHDLDVVVGNNWQTGSSFAGSSVDQLLLNDGSGQFTTAPFSGGFDETNAVALGDLDGDGDLDFVGARSGDSHVRINNGRGNFGSGRGLGASGFAVALGDVDGDGDLDIAIGKQGRSRLFRNDGGLTFTDVTQTHFPTGTAGTRGLAFGDVDGDGDLDLAFANELISSWSGQNWLLLNDGAGRFAHAEGALPRDTDDTYAVAFADIDADGDLDLALANGGTSGRQQNRLYLNDGRGRFTDITLRALPVWADITPSIAFADVDRDGDPDLVVGNFQTESQILLNQHRQLHAADFPRPGRSYPLEIVAKPGYATHPQQAIVYLNVFERTPRFSFGIGLFGIEPNGIFVLGPVTIPAPSGVTVLPIPLPPASALQGLTLYSQALVLHSANPQEWRLTNVLADPIR